MYKDQLTEDIVKLRGDNVSFTRIADKLNITIGTARNVYYTYLAQSKLESDENPYHELYSMILSIGLEADYNKNSITNTYNVLVRAGITSIDKLKDVTDDEICKFRRCGPNTLSIISLLRYKYCLDNSSIKKNVKTPNTHTTISSDGRNIVWVNNKDIINARNNGESFSSIAKRFGISVYRVASICEDHSIREKLKETDEVYNAISSVVTDNDKLVTRVYNILKYENIDTIDKIKNMTDTDIDELYGCGVKTADVIRKIRGK